MTPDNLPLLAILGLALFVGGFLTGFGMYGWLRAPEAAMPVTTPFYGAGGSAGNARGGSVSTRRDPSDEAGA